MEWLFNPCIFRNLWQYKMLHNELNKNTTWRRTVPKIVVIIFHEMEKDSLRKGGITIVCEKEVN